MTYEEQLQLIELFSDAVNIKGEYYLGYLSEDDVECIKTALEKRIPKKPHMFDTDYYACPNDECECYRVIKGLSNFCINCGQAIDWSEAE